MNSSSWSGVLGFGAAAILGAACAAGGADDTTETSAGATSTSSAGSGGSGDGGAATTGTGSGGDPLIGTGGGSTGGDGCSDEAKLVYVLGKTRELYSFDPATLSLASMGVVDCPQDGAAATPFSMAVDRSGTAWVLYNDGHLYKVDTKTASCEATTFVPNQHSYKKFGMGFVSDAPGSTAETLYVAGEVGIAKIDTESLVLTPVGEFGFSAGAELTGTGDARLYGFFFGFPPYISEIDKETSALLDEAPLDTVDIGTGFAFAFWGGDFWVFTAPDGSSSQIDQYRPVSKTTTTVKMDLGFKVIGAGVSTCAPVEPPS